MHLFRCVLPPSPLHKATVRSSTLGGDLYTPAVPAPNKEDATVDAATSSAAETAAYAIERENLVRTLGSILRPKPTPTPPAAGDSKHMPPPPAPSSNVPAPGVVVTKDAKAYLVATAETAKLAAALVSFLPPAREDGAQGVTAASAPMRPEWRAPPAVTANVCVCLLHLLDGERCGIIADQVMRYCCASSLSRSVEGAGEKRLTWITSTTTSPCKRRPWKFYRTVKGDDPRDNQPRGVVHFVHPACSSCPISFCPDDVIGGRCGRHTPPDFSLRQLGRGRRRSIGAHERRDLPCKARTQTRA